MAIPQANVRVNSSKPHSHILFFSFCHPVTITPACTHTYTILPAHLFQLSQVTSRPPFCSCIQYRHLSALFPYSNFLMGWCVPVPERLSWQWPTESYDRTTSASIIPLLLLRANGKKGRWLLEDPPAPGRSRSEWHTCLRQPFLLAVISHIPVAHFWVALLRSDISPLPH